MTLAIVHPALAIAAPAFPGPPAHSSFEQRFAATFAGDLVAPNSFSSQTDVGGDVGRRLLGMHALENTSETAHAYLKIARERWQSGDAKNAATAAFESAIIFSALQDHSMAASVRRLLAAARVFQGNLEGAAEALSSACQDHFFQADLVKAAQVIGGFLAIYELMRLKNYEWSAIGGVTTKIAVYSDFLAQDINASGDEQRLRRCAAMAWRLRGMALARSDINMSEVDYSYKKSARLFASAGLLKERDHVLSVLKGYLLKKSRADLAQDIALEPQDESNDNLGQELMEEFAIPDLVPNRVFQRRARVAAHGFSPMWDGQVLVGRF